MIIELGHFAVVLALMASLAQCASPWLPVKFGRQAAFSAFWLFSIGFLALLHAYALSDFSVVNVAMNSHSLKPLVYKLSALWGNHEGSMLLWLWMMAGWTAAFAGAERRQSRRRLSAPDAFARRVLAVQGALAAGFALFLLLASNPFLRIDPPLPEGMDLNPLLQDPLLAIHPPFLYLGITGFSLAFSLALAALWGGRVDGDFAAALRPWVLASFAALTAGITLGAFWAYYELGWGGFWFWDPVENLSLLPWLAGAALLHSLRAVERRGVLTGWTALLSLLTFILAVLGTFLVRSGLLTSVHAFAADPLRGVVLLGLATALTAAAFGVYALRAPKVPAGAPFGWISRDAGVLANNLFLSVAAVTVFLGTLYPVVLPVLGVEGVSVGAPYYTAVLAPLLPAFALAMGAAPFCAWRQTPRAALRRGLRLPVLLTVAGLLLLAGSAMPKTPLVFAGIGSGLWILAATLCDLLQKSDLLRRWRQITLPQMAMALGHAGFAVMLIGATAATQWKSEETLWMKPGQRQRLANHTILLLGVESGVGRNYNADRAIFSLQPVNDPAAMRFVMPEKRWYPAQEKQTSESALSFFGGDILYVVLGEQDTKDPSRWVVRLYYHPLVIWVFAGGAMIALGAALALFDRNRPRANT